MLDVKELRGKSAQELKDELVQLRRTQFDTRIQYRTGQYANTAKFKEMRADIARIKTVLNEKSNSE